MEKIDELYNDDIEELKEQKAISDSIKVAVHVEWFDEEKDHLFIAKTNEEEELGFGLMPGVHLEILKKGGDVSVLFAEATGFDKDRIYTYIWEVAQNAEKENIIERMVDRIELYGDEDRRREWHEKWDLYLEVN